MGIMDYCFFLFFDLSKDVSLLYYHSLTQIGKHQYIYMYYVVYYKFNLIVQRASWLDNVYVKKEEIYISGFGAQTIMLGLLWVWDRVTSFLARKMSQCSQPREIRKMYYWAWGRECDRSISEDVGGFFWFSFVRLVQQGDILVWRPPLV